GGFQLPDLAAHSAGRPVTRPGRVDDGAADPDGGIAREGDAHRRVEPAGRLHQAQHTGAPQLAPVDVAGVTGSHLLNQLTHELEVLEHEVVGLAPSYVVCRNHRCS